MKRLISVLWVCLLLGGVAMAAGTEADAVYLEVNKTYTLNDDGSMRFDYHHKVKLLTYFAVNRWLGETFIVTQPEYQTLTVDLSQTTMADGQVVDSPENAFNEVLPRAVHRAPAYANLREMVVTHIGLERGCVVELKYHIDTRPGFMPWLMGEELFGMRGPVERMSITVNVPEETALGWHMLNGSTHPETQTEAGVTRYRWAMTGLPLLNAEPGHADFADTAPRLLFSTCPGWHDLAQWVARRFDQPVAPEDGVWMDAMLQQSQGLNLRRRVLDLRRQVAEELGRVSFDPALCGYHVSPPGETYKRNYGTSLDKAVLLAALINRQGASARPALVSRHQSISSRVPSLFQFDAACVIAETGDEAMILETHGQQKYAGQETLAGHVLLDVQDGPALMKIHRNMAQNNLCHVRADLSLTDDLKLAGPISIKVGGAFYPRYHLLEDDEQSAFVIDCVRRLLGGGEISQVRVLSLGDELGEFSCQLVADGLFEKIEGTDLFRFVGLGSALDSESIPVALTRRETPLAVEHTADERISLQISLPESVSLTALPQNGDITLSTGHLMNRWEKTGRTLAIERQLILSKPVITPEEYGAFRQLMISFKNQNQRQFILKRN